jgi:hypothetical protein
VVTNCTKVSPLPRKHLFREAQPIVTIRVYSGHTFSDNGSAYDPPKSNSLCCACFSCVEAAEFYNRERTGLDAHKPPSEFRRPESGKIMSDATPAVVFVLMLIAPCAIALMGDRRKAKEAVAPVDAKSKGRPAAKTQANTARVSSRVSSGSVPVFTAPPEAPPAAVSMPYAQPPRLYTHGPDPYAQAARLYAQPASYAQPESSFVQPYLQQQRSQVREVASMPPVVSYAQSAASLAHAAEQAETEALVAQAAAAKAHAAALAAAARAAQAKANQAAELAKQAAHEAEIAHRAADYERDVQAQITAQEHARTASGEHNLPASHPSLDFPRSGRGRRAA